MKKQCIIIEFKGKPIYVAQITELETKELFELQKECEKNREQIIKVCGDTIDELDLSVRQIKQDIKILKGED